LGRGELKASKMEKPATLRLLKEIAKQDISIVGEIVDQQAILNPPIDDEEIYTTAVTCAVYRMVEKYPSAHITIDSRYTKNSLRDKLEQAIREGIRDLQHRVVIIRQESSLRFKELQAIDAIVWAFFQKYEHGDSRFYEIIANKIAVEELISEKDWQPNK
jgi:hypothetical protein